MKNFRYLLAVSAVTLAFAAAARVYPGATLDEDTMRKQGSMDRKVYRTTDSFEKVYSFYKGFAKEDLAQKKAVEDIGANTAPNGQAIKRAYLSFEGNTIALIRPAVHRDKTIDDATFISIVPTK